MKGKDINRDLRANPRQVEDIDFYREKQILVRDSCENSEQAGWHKHSWQDRERRIINKEKLRGENKGLP